MEPQLSVIIPAYNEEAVIGNCLKSVFNQSFPKEDYEVIVVDNNSTDKTGAIVKRNFPQSRVIKECKQGVTFARARGVKEAKGGIVALTDADTIVPNDWLKKIFAVYQKDSRVAMVGGPSNFEPKDFFVNISQFIVNIGSLITRSSLGHNLSFKKEAYLKIGGFSPKINLCEDYYISHNLIKVGKFVYLRDNSVTSSSRRFTNHLAFGYALKVVTNILTIFFFNKTFFFSFKNVRSFGKGFVKNN